MAVATRLHELTIAEAADQLAAHAISPVELTEAVLRRIEAVDGKLKAYVRVMGDEAMAAAVAAEEALVRGDRLGPLHGIPLALKDLFATAGVPTEAGSKVLAGHTTTYDSTVTTRLKAAGAVIVGKTVTHEFAYGQNVPPTCNPWDLARTPGGSSAGSGAAVAARACLGAMGTDTGGSIRMPAAVNGIVGLKPTFGRVSKYGVTPLSWSLDHCGPMTTTVEDAALMLQAIAGRDPRDVTSADVPVPDYSAALAGSVRGLRLGVPGGYFFRGMHQEVRDAFEAALAVLVAQGAERVDVAVPHVELAAAIGIGLLVPEASSIHQRMLRASADAYDPATRAMLELGELLPATQYLRAQRARAVLKAAFRETFTAHNLDALLLPTEPTTATLHDQTSVVFPDTGEEPFFAVFVRQTIPFNITGLPALSVPCGFSSEQPAEAIAPGMPIGMMIAGRPFDEAMVLRIGHAYQGATDWHRRLPPL